MAITKEKTQKTKKTEVVEQDANSAVKPRFRKDPTTVVKYPVSTEKSLKLAEAENKLIFVIDFSASKEDVKQAIETQFNAKVKAVNTFVTSKGIKKAYVTFDKETPAIDVATSLGIL